MLRKLSDHSYKVDNSGTVTINLGEGGILKASPTEFLVIADAIVKLQTESIRLKAAETNYMQVLNALDIPAETVAEIQRRLHGEIHKPTEETKQHAKVNNVAQEHKMLYQFVTAFVNSSTTSNDFEAEEFSVFDHEIKSLPNILEKYGFDVEIDDGTIRISLSGDNYQHEKQCSD